VQLTAQVIEDALQEPAVMRLLSFLYGRKVAATRTEISQYFRMPHKDTERLLGKLVATSLVSESTQDGQGSQDSASHSIVVSPENSVAIYQAMERIERAQIKHRALSARLRASEKIQAIDSLANDIFTARDSVRQNADIIRATKIN